MYRRSISVAALTATFFASSAIQKPGAAQVQKRPTTWTSVSAGDIHVCALTTGGKAYCWNKVADAGNASAGDAPRPVPGGLTFTAISAGNLTACRSSRDIASAYREFCFGRENHHTCAITAKGEAYCWGGNSDGQLGDGTTTDRAAPVRVAGGLTFASISAGDAHACGVTAGGVAYCWGRNAAGELGTGTSDPEPHPRPELVARDVRVIAAGVHFSCAIDVKGAAFCWGDNYQARLGSSTADPASPNPSPVPVDGGHRFAVLSTGETHACGVTEKGEAYCWGSNVDGELGPEPTLLSSSQTPVRIPGPTFTAISAGLRFHSCGMDRTGVGYCWGRNSEGQLGVGARSPESCSSDPCSTRPVPVTGGLKFKSLSAGRGFTCGVTVSGKLYCWGAGWSARPDSRAAGKSGTPVLVKGQ